MRKVTNLEAVHAAHHGGIDEGSDGKINRTSLRSSHTTLFHTHFSKRKSEKPQVLVMVIICSEFSHAKHNAQAQQLDPASGRKAHFPELGLFLQQPHRDMS